GALSTFDKDFDDSGNKIQHEFIYNTIGFDLDRLVEVTKIPLPDHVKIDVDGLEHFILAGAKIVFKNVKSILVEINDDFKEQSNKSDKILTDLGFYLYEKVYPKNQTIKVANQIWKKKI
ncbi:MAG: FkbM family methyltransferase, partial [Flavobacteriaceae bacterium]